MSDEGKRRSTHIEHTLSYAAVGAAQAGDLLKYPPTHSHPFQFEVQLGSGDDRFAQSTAALMTWAAQRDSGIGVRLLEQSPGVKYTQVEFTSEGVPEPTPIREHLFAADGTAFAEQGDLVALTYPDGHERNMRVITVTVTPHMSGFIMGSASPHDFVGEQWFRIEHREDDSVWAVARGFTYDTRKSAQKLLFKQAIRQEHERIREQLTALTPANQATKKQRSE